jgi:short-subunit dehydrogenase
MYTKILIAGANSYIASQCVPGLNLGDSEIFLVSRDSKTSKYQFGENKVKSLEIKDFGDGDSLKILENFLQLNSDDRLLIINFIGSFGSIESLDTLNMKNFSIEVGENLIPFMLLAKLIARCKEGLFLSFAGAGIGGDNLEVASLSYLAAKASIVHLVEGLDNLLRDEGIRVGAISPGAFPSRMQKEVAKSQNALAVSKERKDRALMTLAYNTDPSKLISMLNFLMANPNVAGGRVWSANFDSLQTKLPKMNFGKMRRTF